AAATHPSRLSVSSSVSSSTSAPSSSNSTSVLVANGNQQLPKSQDGPSNGSSGQPEPEPLYHCGECGKTFTHLSSLRRHLRSHGLTPESQSRKLDCNSPSPERIFCCGECGKRFKKRGHLIQHSVTHSENRPFVCSICQKSFNRLLGGLGFGNLGGPSSTSSTLNGSTIDPNSIVRRRRSPAPPGDGSERPYGCQICGKRFRRAETLRRHNRVHTGEKPHACEVCGKMFREPFHLTKHLTVHSGQKNYKCNLCGKLFAYAQSLVRHGKLHRKGEIDNQGRRIKGGAVSQESVS
uniref:C2H2-type domain-containing protein n=1 Tax=Oryzias latipes TaxID=8090 RepID=A0A3P9K9T6_ORYLA